MEELRRVLAFIRILSVIFVIPTHAGQSGGGTARQSGTAGQGGGGTGKGTGNNTIAVTRSGI
jgi:hypothetical protein